MLHDSQQFYEKMATRRTVRDFSSKDVDPDTIRACIRAAGTAPSGANLQPWHFSIIRSKEIKKQIREAAEEEEKAFYNGRAGDAWLDVLSPLGTDANKPFLETAPVLIAIFEKKYVIGEAGQKTLHYYSKESTGIAVGMLIAALHTAGLATLTHTPSPMNFLSRILKRPDGERPFLLLVVGHPADDAMVPDIQKKSFEEIASLH